MSEILGEAQIIIRADTKPFLAQIEELRGLASKPIVVPVATTATGAGTSVLTSTRAATTAQTELAGAIAVSNRAKVTQAAVDRKAAQEAANLARHQEQLGRGAAVAGLSFLGLRAQVLAASGAFVAGTVASKILVDSVTAASDRTEQLNKSVEVFAGSAPAIQKWATTTATAIGISETAALAAASTYGELFRTLQIGPQRAAELSQSLVKLASDLASFNNVGTDRALQAIQSGLAGQARPLRSLGIFLTQAIVKQEALNETNKKSASALTQQDIILARYALIVRQAGIQTGDFQRTQERLANQGRILKANLADIEASLGNVLLPILTKDVQALNATIKAAHGLGDAFDRLSRFEFGAGGSSFLGTLLKTAGKALITPIPLQVLDTYDHFFGSEKKIADEGTHVGAAMRDATGAIRGLNDVMGVLGIKTDQTANSMKNLDAAAASASDALLALKAQGASPVAQLAAAQAKLAADQARLAAVPTGRKGSATARRAIEAIIIADRAEIKSLQGEIASAATDAANKLRDARDKADQKILDAISRRQATLENLAARAEGTPGLRDDVIFAKALLTFFERTLRAVRNSALSAKAKADEIAVLTREIIDQQKRVADAIKALADARAAAAQSARDARQTHLEAILSIAETTTQTRDDRAALTALIKFDQIQIDRINAIKRKRKLTQEEKAQLDAYRVDQAQRRQALRNLINEQKKDNTAAREFAFLQTQQGFVSNLLGNLIPLGATSGLVGGNAGPTVPANVRQSLTAAQTTAQANLTRGVTSGQAETQTNLLRRILSELHRLNQGRDHPEASHQRRVGAAIMDTSGNTHGM